jgi:hypothetical protein
MWYFHTNVSEVLLVVMQQYFSFSSDVEGNCKIFPAVAGDHL